MMATKNNSLTVHIGLILSLVVSNFTVVFADSVNTTERAVTKVAEGVYVIRHKDAPNGFPQGNTTVVIGDREVLVVDSGYLPSSAREDIAQIRQWTNKPVRYLLNTHWHFDHTMGNRAYEEAFPALSIIAHTETLQQMRGYNPVWLENYPKRAAALRQQIETGKGADGKELTEEQKARMTKTLTARESVVAEFKNYVERLPNLIFDNELKLDLGNREVQVQFLGLGNTAGDAIAYLPKERIVVAGDLLAHPVPYLAGGRPAELIKTLQRIDQMDAQTIVTGHGSVLRDEIYLKQVIEFLQIVIAEVNKAYYQSGTTLKNVDDVKKVVQDKIDINAWALKFAGSDKDSRQFFESFSFPGVIEAAYVEIWAK